MKKNAFTLIELLAVIVILAIIAVITVPIVSNIIDKAEVDELELQAKYMLEAGQNYFVDNFDTAVPDIADQKSIVSLSNLVADGYIDDVYEPNSSDTTCDYSNSFVEIGKAVGRKFLYSYTLVCGSITITDANLNTALAGYTTYSGSPDQNIGAWLSDWEYRKRITVDSSKIDEDLTYFPLTIHLSTSNGTDAIFNEVTTNNKKIAFTTADAQTQLYAEIEDWDYNAKTAAIHVSKSAWDILASSNTTLYLYYDNSKSDNTTYIGDYASVTGQNVWNSNYVMVQHMGSSLVDSTGNGNAGTNNGTSTINGVIGSGRNFDGSNEITVAHANALLGTGNLSNTISIIAKANVINVEFMLCGLQRVSGERYYLGAREDNNLDIGFGGAGWDETGVLNADTNYNHYTLRVTAGVAKAYKNSSLADTHTVDTSVAVGDYPFPIGGYRSDTNTFQFGFDGIIDEFRISNIARSDAWIKAEYNSLFDLVLTFGSQESY